MDKYISEYKTRKNTDSSFDLSYYEYVALLRYEARRNNNSRFKQSYEDYVAFLFPKIWEIPDVRIGSSIRDQLARRELMFITRDIRETNEKIQRLQVRMLWLQEHFETLFKEEKSELSKIANIIKHQKEWAKDLAGFKARIQEGLQKTST